MTCTLLRYYLDNKNVQNNLNTQNVFASTVSLEQLYKNNITQIEGGVKTNVCFNISNI